MAKSNVPASESINSANHSSSGEASSSLKQPVRRRAFLKGVGVAGAALTAGTMLPNLMFGEESSGSLTKGDASILRFLAAAEIIETDLWQQYNELGGIQDAEVPGGSGSPLYQLALQQLDGDMPQYIHDNTEDEMSHELFINAYLASKGADTVSLDEFRQLESSKADGAQQIGRLTNLMQLTVDTSWWTRYRSRTGNPDLGDMFENAVPDIGTNQHPAIPRSNDDVKPDPSKPNNVSDLTQLIANIAGFHFAFIEQGGSSLYPMLAQRVTSTEVLRILLSIGGVEICHFQTWHDKAGNAPQLTNVLDPVTKLKVSFPNLNNPTPPAPFVLEDLQTNLIMPEPTKFLNRNFPAVSIIRPTETRNAARNAVKGLMMDGLFIGQNKRFFEHLRDLAEDADEARRERD